MPLIIALTGGIGSGKSSVADILQQLGATIVDTDAISHALTAPGQAGARAIGLAFGPDYLQPDGALDRHRMRAEVFSNPAARAKLEGILHPLIRASVRAALESARGPYIVIVVPLLVETGAYRELARRTLVVDCSEQTQIERVMRRSRLTESEVKAIMATQASRDQRLAYADDIVRNDGDLAALRADSIALHETYMSLSGAAPPAK